MKKLPISKSVNLTKPTLSIKYFLGLIVVVAMLIAAYAGGQKVFTYLGGMTKKARGHVEESGILPGE